MSTDMRETIRSVVGTVLEDWAMCYVEPAEEPSPGLFDNETSFFVSSLSFTGPVHGSYCVLCQEDFMNTLAENLVGDLEELTDKERSDALGEFANVLCGNMLTEVYGEDPVFDLTPPVVSSVSSDSVSAYFNPQAVAYLADDAPVVVTFLVHGG